MLGAGFRRIYRDWICKKKKKTCRKEIHWWRPFLNGVSKLREKKTMSPIRMAHLDLDKLFLRCWSKRRRKKLRKLIFFSFLSWGQEKNKEILEHRCVLQVIQFKSVNQLNSLNNYKWFYWDYQIWQHHQDVRSLNLEWQILSMSLFFFNCQL